MAAERQGVWLVNIYTQSGGEKQHRPSISGENHSNNDDSRRGLQLRHRQNGLHRPLQLQSSFERIRLRPGRHVGGGH